MPARQLVAVLALAVAVFGALYVPQPLLPTLRDAFGVSASSASLLITATLLPLGLAPVGYGYLLDRLSARSVARAAALVLALSLGAMAMAQDFALLVGLRFVQGLATPALITALMTCVSRASTASTVSRSLAMYVAFTIVGGAMGRIVAGAVAQGFGWRAAFLTAGLGMAAALAVGWRWLPEARPARRAIDPLAAARLLGQGPIRGIYALIFLAFGSFVALLTYMPFRLEDLGGGTSDMLVGFMYSGYMTGVVVSLRSGHITRRLGGPGPTLMLGMAVMILAVLGFLLPSRALVFADVFVLCAGMFMVHSVAPGLVNRLAGADNAAAANGVYIASYYLGGTCGSLLPGYLYRVWGWGAFIAGVTVIVLVGLALAWRLARLLRDHPALVEEGPGRVTVSEPPPAAG